MAEVKSVASFTATLVFVGCLLVTLYPEWIRNSSVSTVQYLSGQNIYQGIWVRCSSSVPGAYSCDSFDTSILSVALDIQVSRALMCGSTLLSFIGLLLSILTLECTTMVTPGTKCNDRVGIGAGVCCLLAGIGCGGAVSWFAWRVTNEYYSPIYGNREFKFEFGACLYIGWVTMLLALISSLVLIIGSFRDLKREKRDTYVPATSAYHPPSNATTNLTRGKLEYV